MMTRSVQRLLAACLSVGLLGALPVLATAPAAAAPSFAASPSSSGTKGGTTADARTAYEGWTSGGGFLNLKLSNVKGKIQVRWNAGKTPNKAIQKWVVRTSTSRDMRQHAKSYVVARKKRSALVAHSSLVTPASGDYTFIEVSIVRRIPRGKVFTSPTRWIKAPVTVVPASTGSVPVASFNVRSWNLESSKSDPYSWANRRDRLFASIISSGAGVVGLQEASGSDDRGYSADKERQYHRIQSSLAALDPTAQWTLTNTMPYTAPGYLASGRQGTRILYKAADYTLLEQGFWRFNGIGANDTCWVPWAHFEQKSTGYRFSFISAHLTTGKDAKGTKSGKYWTTRNNQTDQIIAKVDAFRAAYPAEQVIVVGDMNSTIYSAPDNGVHRKYVAAGFYDAFASSEVTNGDFPTTNDMHFPVAREPHRRDYILSKGPLAGSYWYRNYAYTSASQMASDHFLQVASLPIGLATP